METIVVYQSSTGFTKQYAQWIAQDLNCEAIEVKKFSEADAKKYDNVIMGGWIMGNMIMGLDDIRKLNPKNLIIFAVGASKDRENIRAAIKEVNKIEDTPFFYMTGGMHWKELNFLKKGMLSMIKKSIAKKEDKTEQDIEMEQTLGNNVDNTDRKYIGDLVSYVKAL